MGRGVLNFKIIFEKFQYFKNLKKLQNYKIFIKFQS